MLPTSPPQVPPSRSTCTDANPIAKPLTCRSVRLAWDPATMSSSSERIDRTLVALGSFGAVFCTALALQAHSVTIGLAPIADRFSRTTTGAATETDVAPPGAGPSFVRASDEAQLADDTPPPLPPKPVFAAAGAGGSAASANVPKPKQPIEDTCVEPLGATGAACKRFAMDGFYAQLAATEGGKATAP